MKYFLIFIGIAALFLGLSLLFLPVVYIYPYKFALLFSFASINVILALVFYNGSIKFMFSKDKWMFSLLYIVSIIFTVWASLIIKSYILTFLAIIGQGSAMLWFFCTSFPGGSTGLKFMFGMLFSTI